MAECEIAHRGGNEAQERLPGFGLLLHELFVEEVVDELVDGEGHELFASGNVVVQCHRLDVERHSQPPHRERLDAEFIDVGNRCLDNVLLAQTLAGHDYSWNH